MVEPHPLYVALSNAACSLSAAANHIHRTEGNSDAYRAAIRAAERANAALSLQYRKSLQQDNI